MTRDDLHLLEGLYKLQLLGAERWNACSLDAVQVVAVAVRCPAIVGTGCDFRKSNIDQGSK